jgi:hypothetical protein
MSEGIDPTRAPLSGAGRLIWRANLAAVLCVVSAALGLPGCGNSINDNESTKVNGSIHVSEGQQPGAVATVNGSILIDDNAVVTSATTVNGTVRLGAHATAASLNSVNGSISLRPAAHVSGSASSVNGDLNLADGAEVSGALSNVNGMITLTGAHVAGGIKTVNGSMDIVGASHVEGGILVQKPSSELLQMTRDTPRIVIGPGATVQGELRFERTVRLFVSDKATIGAVTGATAVPFTGERPPN